MEVSASVYDEILKQRFPREEGESDTDWLERRLLWAEEDRILPDTQRNTGKLVRSAGASPANE